MRKMHKKINIVLIFMLMSVFAALDAGYALRPPSQFNEQKPRQNHFEYIMKRLTSDRFSIIDDDRNHAAEKILKRFAEGYLPDTMPYQIQLDLTAFCPTWNRVLKTGQGSKDCRNCSFPEKSNLHVNIDVLLELLQYFEKNGGRSVFVTGGGEPGAYKNWHDLFLFLADSTLGLTLNTNGLFVRRLELEYKKGYSDILRKVFSEDKEPAVISISIHDETGYRAAEKLNVLRNELGLNIIIRNTFMVHADTKPEELFEFIEKSERSGADLAVFKPEHVFMYGERMFNTNEQAFEIIRDLVIKQENINKGVPEYGHQYNIVIQAMRPNRLSGLFENTRSMIRSLIRDGNDPLCLGPLCNFYVNSRFSWGMCCDTKDIGMGSVPAEVFGTGIPQRPEDYYIEAMWGIIKLDPQHCITGCGFMEPNFRFPSELKLGYLVKELKLLRAKYRKGEMSEVEIKERLRNFFKLTSAPVETMPNLKNHGSSI
ncbi:MAG: hypothetical protein AUJ70_03865 [Candidatus Omnitrophica bacterium CG1_02_40_15]|nr:MAG: hypothetical protein AUJ70_03865 [Candidatus Omnitrophica bacterium CG1_02_40_15]